MAAKDPPVSPVDQRQSIIAASMTVLREHGFAGFTQPRVAAQAGLRQSHLTYYYPTRAALLEAVARAAIDRQLRAADSILEATSPRAASALLANVVARHENTRVIMALAQAADQEPALRKLFVELAEGVLSRVGKLLTQFDRNPSDEHCYLLHAVSVGMAVITLATGREDSERRSARTIERLFRLLKET